MKSCANGTPGHGNRNPRMTLRSSTDSALQLAFPGYDSASSPGRSSGEGSPPDSPDEKYWSFAAAAASINYEKSDLKVSVEIPDYHYNDRMYLHKHGLPIIGKHIYNF